MLGKLSTLRHKLLEEQLEEKWLIIRKDILTKQKDNCCQEKDVLNKELVRIHTANLNANLKVSSLR